MRPVFVLTEPITIVPGTEFELMPDGGCELFLDRGLIRVTIGRAAGLSQGMLTPKRQLKVVS